MYSAVCFDIGGVVVGSPVTAIGSYEETLGLPHDYLNALITFHGKRGPFQLFETGKISWDEFHATFGPALSDVDRGHKAYKEYCAKKGIPCPNLPTQVSVDGRELYRRMMTETATIVPVVEAAIRKIKAQGRFKIAAWTNTFARGVDSGDPLQSLGLPTSELKDLFDYWIESSVIGKRKPDQEFFTHALGLIDKKPEDVIFLDDIGINCKAAKEHGIKTIRVFPGKIEEALAELSSELQLGLVEKTLQAKL